MARKLVKTLCFDSGGWFAEVYTDDDNGSGYGDHAWVGTWYGTRKECEEIDPTKVTLYPIHPGQRR